MMTPEQLNALANSLAELGDAMAIFEEQAKGIRDRMIREGWGPASAEEVAATWLKGAVRMMWRGVGTEDAS